MLSVWNANIYYNQAFETWHEVWNYPPILLFDYMSHRDKIFLIICVKWVIDLKKNTLQTNISEADNSIFYHLQFIKLCRNQIVVSSNEWNFLSKIIFSDQWIIYMHFSYLPIHSKTCPTNILSATHLKPFKECVGKVRICKVEYIFCRR